jgi:hypothetical protein
MPSALSCTVSWNFTHRAKSGKVSGQPGTMAAEIENDYLLHNDNELTRQALQHVIIKDATNGKQVFAPVKFDGSPLNILDACTGSGKCQPLILILSYTLTDSTRFVDP